MSFVTEARGLAPDLVALRRRLHADPETGLHLPRTQAAILEELASLGLDTTTGTGCSSVVAVLRGGRPGPTVLLRGDMDALPLPEETGLPFASENGAMHACGHDLHVAGLVGAARLLHARRDELPGSVVFMFQPGEEGAGGARVMLDEGVLDAAGDRVVAAYGIHVMRGRPGVFTTRPGPFMAGASAVTVTVRGHGGHASEPTLTRDPVPAAAEIILALQSFVTRRFDVFDPVVLTIAMVEAGHARNIIPDSVRLAGSARTLSARSTEALRTELPALVAGVAEAHGCRAEVEVDVHFAVTVNDRGETEDALETLGRTFGEDRVERLENPIMGSEDFSSVLERVPGLFLHLGATPAGIDPAEAESNHSPRVVFDDAVLGDQAAALAQLAWDRLSRGRDAPLTP